MSCLNGSFCAMLKADSYEPMHVTYNALVISSVVFSLLELLAAVTNPIFLKRLQVMRIQHELKEDEEEGEGKEKKKKADLRRLFTLAKRVSFYL